MKRFGSLLVLVTFALAHPTSATLWRWDIDPSHSSVGFIARHLAFAKVRGKFH